VLGDGKLVEYDKPYILLSQENGVFAGMVKRHGETFYNEMMRLAKEKMDK